MINIEEHAQTNAKCKPSVFLCTLKLKWNYEMINIAAERASHFTPFLQENVRQK